MNRTSEFYTMLKRGPALLLLGQAYLQLESGTDPFLAEVLRKYGKANPGTPHYGSYTLGRRGADWRRKRGHPCRARTSFGHAVRYACSARFDILQPEGYRMAYPSGQTAKIS